MEKADVRQYLADRGFAMRARQAESMEICFVEKDYRDFLRRELPDLEAEVAGGRFVDTTGRTLGTHRGVPFYTVGQRRGLGIALGEPAYVLRLNAAKNTIVLGRETDLLTNAFFAEDTVAPDEEQAVRACRRGGAHTLPQPARGLPRGAPARRPPAGAHGGARKRRHPGAERCVLRGPAPDRRCRHRRANGHRSLAVARWRDA